MEQFSPNLTQDPAGDLAFLEQAILKTSDAEGIVVDGEAVEYRVIDTCLRGEFTEYDTIVIKPCK